MKSRLVHIMTQPKVSIIIPVYNTEKYLRECLDSVISQTFKDIEIICVNDGSTDSSGDILMAYAQTEPRIQLIHQENQGTFIARKAGINQSTGEFILFVDPDDKFSSFQSLETAVSLMERNNADILQFSVEVFGNDAEKVSDIQKLLSSANLRIEGSEAITRHVIGGDFTWHLWNKVFNGDICRRAVQETEDIRLYSGSDAYLFLVIAAFSETYLSQKTSPLYVYRVGQGITTHRGISLDDFRNYVSETRIVALLRTVLDKRQPFSSSKVLLASLEDRFLDHCLRRFIQLSPSDREQGYRMLVGTFGEEVIQAKTQVKSKVSYWKYKVLSKIGIKKKRAHYKDKSLLLDAIKNCLVTDKERR